MKTSKLTLVCDIYELTNKDRKNIQKLVREIEEGKGVAEKFRNRIFKKSNYNASTILLTKIIYKYQDREKTLSLLHYAISHKNNQAVKDLLEEAKKQKLLKEVLNEEMTTNIQMVGKKSYQLLTDAISRRDNDIMRAVLKPLEENGILKDILKKRIIIKHSNGEEQLTPHSPMLKRVKIVKLNESNTIAIKDIAASIEKLDNTGICENSTTNIFTEIAAQPTLSTADSTDKANTLSSTEMKSCFDNGSSKENTADKKEKPLMQQRRAILVGVVGAALLVSSIVAYISKMYAIAVIGGIVGLACISFALYDALKPSTQLEKVENVEQSIIAHPPLKAI
ncbi:uncharacterized protein TNCT_490701 [Trichonephila clavata]|uniref:Ankyrin repeat domain protein n=1 Tax=Trichonephila clavata TaxID=2740835 RepID=A0A8X6LCY2_TRICU|nr:uncharacterized protein TNCT_490701 [Trichonephila clavata]